MGFRTFYGKEPHTHFIAGWLAGRIVTTNRLNYCVIFLLHTQLTNAAADCIIQPGGLYETRSPRVGYPTSKTWSIIKQHVKRRFFILL